MPKENGWIGVDFDGTLARDGGGTHSWLVDDQPPVPAMVERVKRWLAEGKQVRIVTARANPVDCAELGVMDDFRAGLASIARWCQLHLGAVLPIVCSKDYQMLELWDDRAVQVVKNRGVDAAAPCCSRYVSDGCSYCYGRGDA